MNKYINAEKLKAEIERLKGQLIRGACASQIEMETNCKDEAYNEVLTLLDSIQQEQPIEGKQVIIITETDGGANIHWDCRSLEDVRALLTSAESFIIDKQVEEARGQGSAPDYNTTEGRFRDAHKLRQEQPDNMIQWTGNNLKEVIDFTGKSPRFGEWFKSWEEYENYVHTHNDTLKLLCEDGSHYEVPVGAWIVKTPDGYNVPSVSRFIHANLSLR